MVGCEGVHFKSKLQRNLLVGLKPFMHFAMSIANFSVVSAFNFSSL